MKRLILCMVVFGATTASTRPVRLCVVGDSISARQHTLYTAPWPDRLAALHAGQPFGFKDVALSGNTTTLQRVVFDSDVAGHGCTHVAIMLGTNDVANTSDAAATIFGRIDAMATIAESQGAKVLLLAVTPRGDDTGWTAEQEQRRVALNDLLAARSRSLYIDTDTAMREPGAASGTAWAPSTAYAVGDRVVNGAELYIVLTAGTSAASGGPSGTDTSITDGSVVWVFLPRLLASSNGPLHPDDAGEQVLAETVDAAILAVNGW